MCRTGWRRVFAVVYALWFVVVLSEPAALRACAMHDGPSGAEHGHAPSAAPAHHAGAHSTRGHDKTSPCSCVAACCSAPIAVASLRVDDWSLFAATAFEHVSIVARTNRWPAAVEYARPPSIGPPRHSA